MRDELSDAEKASFDDRVKDAEFRSELLNQTQILNAIESVHDEKLKQFFKNVDKGIKDNQEGKLVKMTPSENVKVKRSSFSLLKYAAVLTILLGSFFIVKQYTGDTGSSDLFASYYQTYDSSVIRGRAIDSKELSEALFSYGSNDFSKADKLFSNVTPKSAEAMFFGSICKIELDKLDEAIRDLKTLSSQNSEYKADADWYLALAYLKKGDLNSTKSLLQNMSDNSDHAYSVKALKLLGEL